MRELRRVSGSVLAADGLGGGGRVMKKAKEEKFYRIGDFAKYMGVTPDFLKHYEENGLLQVRYRESGYRYYNFDQSSRILEYMRLRNYGVSVKEMNAMLGDDDEAAMRLLDEKAERLRREADRIAAVLEEHERLKAWYAKRRAKPVDWFVTEAEPYYFLPHSNFKDFIKDERIYPILREWIDWMPVAKSALQIERPQVPGDPYPMQWGMVLKASLAKRFGIPVNDAVIRQPAGKAFVYHFIGMEKFFDMDEIAHGRHPMFAQMAALGLKPTARFHLVVEMKLAKKDGSRKGGCGRFIVPVEEAR